MCVISVIVPFSKDSNSVNTCLQSITEAARFSDCEVIVLVNNNRLLLQSISRRFREKKNIHIHILHETTKGCARNRALKMARGRIAYFIDDDVVIGVDTLQLLIEKFEQHPDIHIVGGPNLTPPVSSRFQQCQGYVLSSFFGTYQMSQRYKGYGQEKVVTERSLILCNLAIRMDVFERTLIYFNEDLVCAEENLLLHQLYQRGFRALFVPHLVVYHCRRANIAAYCSQIYRYGKGRFQTMIYLPDIFSGIFFLPSLFVGYAVFLPFYRNVWFLIPFYLYSAFLLVFTAAITWEKKDVVVTPLLIFLFPLTHISYGLGFLFCGVHVLWQKIRYMPERWKKPHDHRL